MGRIGEGKAARERRHASSSQNAGHEINAASDNSLYNDQKVIGLVLPLQNKKKTKQGRLEVFILVGVSTPMLLLIW